MVPLVTTAALLSLAVWVYLLLLRGGFWRADQRLDEATDGPREWPAVIALVPARDEADVIAAALDSLLSQDYPTPFKIVVVDDNSRDGTAAAARAAARRAGAEDRLIVVTARAPEPGWTGKTWALNEGLRKLRRQSPEARYVWLSDADIAHGPKTLRRLVAKAERERLDLVSLMAELSCEGSWARLLIPPFVFFFQKLYPFSWVSDRSRTTAAAAGGCVLLRAETLLAAGGFAVIKGALIDDCALAAHIKPVARARGRGIWLGLADDSHSLRPYRDLKSIWDMVARSAYTQLRTSPLLVAGSLLGMTLTYLVPPLALLAWPWHGSALAAAAGGLAWASMATAFLPTLRLYRQPPWLAGLLPVGALLYSRRLGPAALARPRRRLERADGRAGPGRHRPRPLDSQIIYSGGDLTRDKRHDRHRNGREDCRHGAEGG
jgi:hopene-associated glycosyltransferase HpnB